MKADGHHGQGSGGRTGCGDQYGISNRVRKGKCPKEQKHSQREYQQLDQGDPVDPKVCKQLFYISLGNGKTGYHHGHRRVHICNNFFHKCGKRGYTVIKGMKNSPNGTMKKGEIYETYAFIGSSYWKTGQ